MKKSQIKIGGYYTVRINGMSTTVRVDDIRQADPLFKSSRRRLSSVTIYDVVELSTRHRITIRTARRFQKAITQP